MAQFRTKTNDIGKNNIAWSMADEGGAIGGGWWAMGSGGRITRSVAVGGCKKTNNCGNSRITVACPTHKAKVLETRAGHRTKQLGSQ